MTTQQLKGNKLPTDLVCLNLVMTHSAQYDRKMLVLSHNATAYGGNRP